MRFAKLFWQMLRPRVAVMLLLFAYLGFAYHGHTTWSWRLLAVTASLAGWYVAATTINDISDEAIDKVNLRHAAGRPLVHRQASRRDLYLLNVLSALVAALSAALLGWRGVLAAIVALALCYAYSLRPLLISYRAYLAPVLLSTAYVAVPYYLGSLAGRRNLQWADAWLLAGMCLAFIGRIILKDLRDVKGDAQFGKRTFVVRHGKPLTCLVSGIFWLLGNVVLFTVLPHSPLLLLAFELYFLVIFRALAFLYVAPGHEAEQLTIGLLAKAANGLLVGLIAFCVLQQNQASLNTQAVIGLALAGFYTGIVWYGLYHPERVTIDYRG